MTDKEKNMQKLAAVWKYCYICNDFNDERNNFFV